ncbi:MAG: DUF3800 domain-containing protein [Algoriphagus sp.]|uniref:DUF3800 domain-containing protein n=2 Tax=Algoriphagus sp. TaxID=1872435 RepID=UPI0032975B2E
MSIKNIYIDESCHLENDGFPVMCIGYLKIEATDYEDIKAGIKSIKLHYKSPTEIKWNKLSISRMPMYRTLIDFFFDQPIFFRCLLMKYKDRLHHEDFNKGDHNSYYYKLVYFVLNSMTNPPRQNEYRVFMDIKDTRGREQLEQIERVFVNKYAGNSPFTHFQHIHSDENELMQLTDLFIGAITYKARGEHLKKGASQVKKEIIDYLENKSGYSLDEGTEPWEEKFNIFDHQPKNLK